MEAAVGKAWYSNNNTAAENENSYLQKGKDLLQNQPDEVAQLKVFVDNVENSKRKVQLLKVHKAHSLFKEMIVFYGIQNILLYIKTNNIKQFSELQNLINNASRGNWINVGGQLIKEEALTSLKENIKTGTVSSWDDVHQSYRQISEQYPIDKLQHAIASMLTVENIENKNYSTAHFKKQLEQTIHTMEWITKGIFTSREKDYQNPFRKITFESDKEMEVVIGKLEDNSFIKQTAAELISYKEDVAALIKLWNL